MFFLPFVEFVLLLESFGSHILNIYLIDILVFQI